MTDAQDNSIPVGAIADLQREAEGFKQAAEGMLVWAEAMMERVKELSKDDRDEQSTRTDAR